MPALVMGWPLRSLWPVSEALGARPVKAAELGCGGEAAGGAHGGDQGRPADGGQAGQAAGQLHRVDPPVTGLPLGLVGGQFGVDGA